MTTIATKYPFVGSIDTRQGGRNENQDNAGFVDTPLGLLLVVCDGMGGGPGGRTASLMAVDTILNVLSDVSEHTPRENALKYAIEKANDILYAKAKETPELRGMGTTVAAIIINEESAVIAHAGDTRIYQLRKGTIIFRSSDHSVVASLVRQNKITEEEARNHPQSNIVTRALGIRPNMEVEFDEVPFLRGDRFVLCTDGIWGMLPQRDLVKSLSRVMGISELTSTAVEEIDRIGHANGGGHDNLTLAIVDTSFDSALKRIKKKSDTAQQEENCENASSVFSKNKYIQMLLAAFVVGALIVVLHFILNRDKNEKFQFQSPLKGITTTTIDKTKDRDSTNMNSQSVDKRVAPTTIGVVGNPFQEKILEKGQRKEIARQISHVMKNLDSLRIIKEKSKRNTEKKKKQFVNEIIKPNISQLESMVIDEKKKNVKEILQLLNDRKTVGSDSNGRITSESKKHIEVIKTKVKELQN